MDSTRQRLAAAVTVRSALIPLMLAVPMLCGCVREDFGDCEYPLRLRLTYLYNREGRDLLREEIATFHLGLYDAETGKYVKSAELTLGDLDADNGYTWTARPGQYNLVVWGGHSRRHTIDLTGDLLTHTATMTGNEDGTVDHEREHLWNAVGHDLLVNGSLTAPYVLDLHKLTNDLRVHVWSEDGAALPGDVTSTVTSSNAMYDFKGALHPGSPTVTYLAGSTPTRGLSDPSDKSDKSDKSDLSDKSDHTDYFTLGTISRNDDSTLKVSAGGTGIYDGSLTELISQQPDIIYDLDDEFDVDFKVKGGDGPSLAVGVYVNGWHVLDYNAILK